MDWLYVLMPISGVNIFWPGLIILGLGVGIIGGFFGMGGAWMVTPGLNILGFPMAFAIGTDVAHMAGKSLISTMRHGKFGNVDYKLGITMLAGTVVGVEIGAQMIMWLERLGSVDKVVRWLYVVLLVCIAWMVFHDVALRRKKEREAAARGEELSATATGLDWSSKLHAIRIPPMVHFHVAGIYCSAWLPIFVSLATGWLAGILGIGGGLIRMPALVYLVGCPTHVAVGTDLFEVAISGLYGECFYLGIPVTEIDELEQLPKQPDEIFLLGTSFPQLPERNWSKIAETRLLDASDDERSLSIYRGKLVTQDAGKKNHDNK